MSAADTPRVGVIFKSNEKLSSIIAYARCADELRLAGGFWISEAHQWLRASGSDSRGAFVTLAAAAMTINHVPVGLAMASPYLRHPAVLASEAAALDELCGQRFAMALGASKVTTSHFEPNLENKPSLKVHREAIHIIRQALNGEQFQYVGSVFAAAMPPLAHDRMDHRPHIPLYLCATGPKLQALAGEVADGVLLPSLTSPAFAGNAISIAARAMHACGRKPANFRIGATVMFCVGDNGAEARDVVRPYVATHIKQKIKWHQGEEVLTAAGLGPDFNKLRGAVLAGHHDITALVTDDMLRQLGVAAGTADEAAAILQSLVAAGVSLLLIEIVGSGEAAILAGMTQLATEVIPRLTPGNHPDY